MADAQIKSTHDDLQEAYSDCNAAEARYETLGFVRWTVLQRIAGDEGVYERGDQPKDLRRKLAEAGYYVGIVGDDRIYQYDYETQETEVVRSI